MLLEEQTVQTQIRLLLMEQSDRSQYCLYIPRQSCPKVSVNFSKYQLPQSTSSSDDKNKTSQNIWCQQKMKMKVKILAP